MWSLVFFNHNIRLSHARSLSIAQNDDGSFRRGSEAFDNITIELLECSTNRSKTPERGLTAALFSQVLWVTKNKLNKKKPSSYKLILTALNFPSELILTELHVMKSLESENCHVAEGST